MIKYVITNTEDKYESHSAYCKDMTDVRHWIINHLDLSKKWEIKTFFDCVSCGHERNLKPNIDCVDCAYSAKRFNTYSKLGLEDRLY